MKGRSNETITVQLKKFNMSNIGNNKVILFIGKRNTGKSVLVLDYLYHNRQYPLGTVISPTDRFNATYRPHIPSIFIHDEYTPELMTQILDRQRDITSSCKENPEYTDVDPSAFVILDDCLADVKDWGNDKNIKWIFMNGRHVNITFILTMQYCLGILPNLRTNVDYIFICREPKIDNQMRLYKYYAGMFPSFDMFRTVLNQCTADYGCLVIDNSSNSEKLDEQVYWYRTDTNQPDWKEFKLCRSIFWKNNEVFIKGINKKKDKPIDYTQLTRRANQPNFNVQQIST